MGGGMRPLTTNHSGAILCPLDIIRVIQHQQIIFRRGGFNRPPYDQSYERGACEF